MIHNPDLIVTTGPSQIRWSGPESSNRLDCETGVLLRSLLAPVFQQSTSWASLRRRLAGKGFDLGFHMGRLVLTDRDTGNRICSCKFLGHPLKSLTERLGRVKVLAPKDGIGRGTLLV